MRFKTTTNFVFRRNDLAHESLDRFTRTLVAVMLNELLNNRYAVPALGNLRLDERTMRFATAAASGLGDALRRPCLRGDFAAGIANGGRFGRLRRPIAAAVAGRRVVGTYSDDGGRFAGRPMEVGGHFGIGGWFRSLAGRGERECPATVPT